MFGRAFSDLSPVSVTDYTGASGLLQAPSRSEYLGANVEQGFERTTTGRVKEETEIMEAERREGTLDEEYRLNEQLLLGQGMAPEDVGMTHSRAMSKESWEASSYYRKGMEYRPDMTETRARIMAENYDQRRYRDQVVAAGDEAYGMLTRGLGFGAMLIGSLPDPINFIPFAGGAAKAQAAIRAAAKSGLGAATRAGAFAGMKAGAIEGAVGNAVVDTMVLPDLAARGEDVGFTDLMLDTVFGAIIGAGLGSAGGALSGYVGGKRLAKIDEMLRIVSEREKTAAEFGTPDNGFLSRFGQNDTDVRLPRNDDADVARAGMTGIDKRDATRAVEKALDDITEGRPVDVGPVLRESQAIGRAYDTVRANPLGGPPDDILTTISSPEFERILVERGPSIKGKDGSIVVRGKDFAKQFGNKAWGLVKIIWRHGEESEAAPRFQVTREDITALPRILREYEPVREAERHTRKKEHRWVVRNEDGVDVVYVVSRRKKGHKEQTLISVFKDDTGKYGASEKRSPLASSAGENPHNRGKSPNYRDTAGGSTAQTPRRQGGTATQESGPNALGDSTVSTGRPNVNYAVEARENYPAAPDVTAHDEQAARDAADAATLQRLEEMTATGRMDEESARQIAESRDEAARAEQYDEMGQSVIECIWNAGA